MDPEQDNPELQQAKILRWAWRIGAYLVVGTVVLTVTSEGFRINFPLLGLKLSAMPALGPLSRFSIMAKLNLGHLFAAVFGYVLCYLLEAAISVWLDPNGM